MDEMDRKIIAALQADGRLSITDLAEQVGLSLSPCHRRVKALEQSGVIRGYRADVDLAAVGLTFSAIVFISMRGTDRATVEAFELAVAELVEVTQAQRLFGDPDYLLHVTTRDLPAYQLLYDEHLSALPGVQRVATTLVMKSVVQDRPLLVRGGRWKAAR